MSAQQIEAAERDAVIARLTLQGKTTREIGAELGLDHTTVARRLKLYQQQWRDMALQDVSTTKGRILDELRMLRAEAWESWRLSRGEQVAVQEEEGYGPKGETGRTTTRTKTTHGDPSYLNAILVSIGQESRLLGLNEPETIELTSKEALRHEGEKLADYTTEQLMEMYRSGKSVPVGGHGEA